MLFVGMGKCNITNKCVYRRRKANDTLNGELKMVWLHWQSLYLSIHQSRKIIDKPFKNRGYAEIGNHSLITVEWILKQWKYWVSNCLLSPKNLAYSSWITKLYQHSLAQITTLINMPRTKNWSTLVIIFNSFYII